MFCGDRSNIEDDSWPTDEQAEVLYFGVIPPTFITSVQFQSAFVNEQIGQHCVLRLRAELANLGLHVQIECNDNSFRSRGWANKTSVASRALDVGGNDWYEQRVAAEAVKREREKRAADNPREWEQKRIENEYRWACEDSLTATTAEDDAKLAERFRKLGDYKDSAAYCARHEAAAKEKQAVEEAHAAKMAVAGKVSACLMVVLALESFMLLLQVNERAFLIFLIGAAPSLIMGVVLAYFGFRNEEGADLLLELWVLVGPACMIWIGLMSSWSLFVMLSAEAWVLHCLSLVVSPNGKPLLIAKASLSGIACAIAIAAIVLYALA